MWRMEWVRHALLTSPRDLFNGNQFSPERGVLAYSDAMMVESLIALPLLSAGLPPMLVHNLLLLGVIAASGIGMFVLARHLWGNTHAAIVAGLIFAFAPYRFSHFMHMELQWAVWMPWAFWAYAADARDRRAALRPPDRPVHDAAADVEHLLRPVPRRDSGGDRGHSSGCDGTPRRPRGRRARRRRADTGRDRLVYSDRPARRALASASAPQRKYASTARSHRVTCACPRPTVCSAAGAPAAPS